MKNIKIEMYISRYEFKKNPDVMLKSCHYNELMKEKKKEMPKKYECVNDKQNKRKKTSY